MVTDPIADLLTRIRNAVAARHGKTVSPYSKLKISILEVLKKHGYIESFSVEKNKSGDQIIIMLSPTHTALNLKRVSKPGQRIYVKKDELKPVLNGYGIALVSTPKGVMTSSDARKASLGGELICEIW